MKVPRLMAADIQIAALKRDVFKVQADKEWSDLQAALQFRIEKARRRVKAPAEWVYNVETGEFQAP